MIRLSCLLGLIGLSWILYCLFQPIIDWNFGWAEIPMNNYEYHFEGIEKPAYLDAIEKSKMVIDSIHKKSSAPSISVAAMIHGKMVWSYAIGLQDIAYKTPADTNTLYRIGSVSKTLTSLGLGRLFQDGKIHPDSSIQFYTNTFKGKPQISIRQLASHQSGIRNYGIDLRFPIWEYFNTKEFESVNESLRYFEADDLLFVPGDDFSYSSYNYTALSYAMEKASENNFLTLINMHVLDPLKMKHTVPDTDANKLANRAVPYDIDGNNYKESFAVNLSNKWAGGGFLSTPSDLVRAGNALLGNTFLKQKTIKVLITPQRLSNDSVNEQNYALGWRHDVFDNYFNGQKKLQVIHHGGMAVGGQSLLAVYPEYDLVFAISINKSGSRGRFELFGYIKPIVESFINSINNS